MTMVISQKKLILSIIYALSLNRMNRLSFSIFIFLFTTTLFSQDSVRVYNQMTDFPIEGVSVFSQKQESAQWTDRDGFCSINEYSDKDTIFFQHIVFKTIGYTRSQLKKMNYKVYLIPSTVLMEELTITASNIRENAHDLPYKYDIIELDKIETSAVQNSADLLKLSGNILIQKSQGGGGSPIIRGFEANKVLLVVDGVRMNNAIYRNGHLQNSITIDNSILELAEIIYGPSSTVYGSDALGGVVHYHTKKPKLSNDNRIQVKGNSYLGYSTVNQGQSAHLDINLGSLRFASLSSVSYNQFGDIRIGSNRTFSNEETAFGLTPHYVGQQADGSDIMLNNPDPLVQLNTGYDQTDFLQKFLLAPTKRLDIEANFHYSTSSNIDRYDQLMGMDGDVLKYAEWHYGPQNRLLASLSTTIKNETSIYTNFKAIISFQKIDEDRIYRKFGRASRLHQEEDVQVFTFNLDFLKLFDLSRFNYGLEYSYNDVVSNGYYQDIFTQEKTMGPSRYPNAGSQMVGAAAYLNYKWMPEPQYIFTAGFRYSYIGLHSAFADNPEMPQLPFQSIDFANTAPTGNVSFVMFPSSHWQLSVILATGFRSPNVDDYGKIRAKNGDVTVPNNVLKPEYAYSSEFNAKYSAFEEQFSVSMSVYQTWLENAIVRANYQLNGSDYLLYDGDEYRIITNLNAATATVRGVSGEMNIHFPIDWSLFGNEAKLRFRSTINYTQGRDMTNIVPLGHISPLFGRNSFSYSDQRLQFSLYSEFNGWKDFDDMSPFGDDNEDKGTADGFPAWWTINLSAQFEFNKHFKLSFAAENLLDEHYRNFASGVSATGRNFVIKLYASF